MCKLCETKPVYEFTNQRKLCRTCFVRWFQKKVLYTIRRFKMIKKNEVVGYKKARDFREVVLQDVLKMFAKKAMVELVKLPISTLRVYPEKSFSTHKMYPERKNFSTRGKIFTRGNKIAIASTTDLEADKIIHFLIKGNVNDLKNVLPVNNKIIKPLYLFLDKEVLLYAKLKKLKFKKEKIKKDKISLFIDELEKKHPEVKQAVVGSFLGV